MAQAPSEPEGGAGGALRPRRTNLVALFSFLGAFVVLLVVFRGVLFPFLMAIFIAYLIEPVVAAFTRSPIFGVRWTRGPTIVLMYILLLAGIVTASSCTVAYVTRTVKDVSQGVSKALRETAERAHFSIAPSADGGEEDGGQSIDHEILVAAGTRVVLRAPPPPEGREPAPAEPPAAQGPLRVFATLYDVVLGREAPEAEVLLRERREAVPPGPEGRILDPEKITSPDGKPVDDALRSRLRVSTGEQASGLLVWVELNLITPIVENLAKAGVKVQPTELRGLLAAQAKALGENLPDKVARWGRDLIARLALSVYEFILILMLTAFIVMDRKPISAFFASLPPQRYRGEYHTLMRYVDRGLAGVIRGQLVICAVNGTLTYFGLLLFQVKGALALSLVAGVFSLIPIFGTILSTIPIVLVAATEGIDKGLLALAWVTLIHLLEANLFNPLIMGSHARMHPVVIIFALLAGEHSFGVWGALLAVPAASIIQSCFQYYRHEIEGVEPPEEKPRADWLRRLLGMRRSSAVPPPATDEEAST